MSIKGMLAGFAIALAPGLAPVAAEVSIQRGVDVFSTAADGKTFYDFSKNPIPANFFCEGSKAFTGRVALKGLPLITSAPGQIGNADTVVERLDDVRLDTKGTAGTTRLRFRALSLVSIAPLQTNCGAFHVYVGLGGKQRTTKMAVRRTDEGGGTFSGPLAVDARMTFIPVEPGAKATRPLELAGRFTFPAVPTPWSFTRDAAKRSGALLVDTNGDQVPDTRIPGTSNFLAGLSPDKAISGGSCCSERVCHMYQGKMHCSVQIPPGCMHAQLCANTEL